MKPGASRRLRLLSVSALLTATAALATGCGGGSADGSGRDPDPTGPGTPAAVVFSVAPLPLATIHEITPVGSNNKVFPTSHTYWHTCDPQLAFGGTPEQQQADPRCHLEQQVLLAPGSGVARSVDPSDDGAISVAHPAGYQWTLGHVTPLVRQGANVTAGQPVARMYYRFGFDFGVMDMTGRKVTNLARPDRFVPYPAVHPVALYADPLRTQLTAFIPPVEGDRFGQQYWDVPGTAMGAWFLQGAPAGNLLGPDGVPYTLFLGRYTLRRSLRLIAVGKTWPGLVNYRTALDAEARDWETITPTSGRVAQRAWNANEAGVVNHDWPAGTFLVEMLAADRLRIEWFDTHEPVTEFTSAARVYIR